MLAAVLVGLYVVLRVGRGATVSFAPTHVTTVSSDPANLPYYAARSLLRMFVALALSTVFTLTYGYAAARSRRAEKVLIPLLDILQSVPVLAFLSVTVTGFIALFPGSLLGLECAAIFAIFTSQAWNMTFSFYYSVRTLPRELDEASRMLRLTRWQRYWKIEVPNGIIGLVWNGMMSFGGGWFFLAASEAISVLNQQYTLPGIGSYVAAAVDAGDLGKVGLAIATMVVMVLAVNVLFWRPLTAWAERYKLEESEAAERQRSLVLDLLRRSSWPRLIGRARRALAEPLGRAMRVLGRDGTAPVDGPERARRRRGDVLFAVVVGDPDRVRPLPRRRRTSARAATARCVTRVRRRRDHVRARDRARRRRHARVGADRRVDRPEPARSRASPSRSCSCSPASRPTSSSRSPRLAFIKTGLSLNVGGILLMSLGAQWYILFNTIAGAMAVPTDLREATAMLGRARLAALAAADHPGDLPGLRDRRDHGVGRRVERLDRVGDRHLRRHDPDRDRPGRLHRARRPRPATSTRSSPGWP